MHRLLYLLILTLLIAAPLLVRAQVFPGDADNNGRVEHYDLLPIGYAFGAVGPARLDAEIEFEEQNVALAWSQNFPGGLNYAYADANGNGLVEIGDFLAVHLNYDNAQAVVDEVTAPGGSPGFDPGFQFDVTSLPAGISQGQLLEIPIRLGSTLQPVSLCGFTFDLEYDNEYVRSLQLSFTGSWLGGSNNALFFFQRTKHDFATSTVSAAQTRFGPNPVTGFGEVGRLSIVIEDDLIGLLPADMDSTTVKLRLRAGPAVDGDFHLVPLVSDSIELTIYHPDYLLSAVDQEITDRSLRLFPNPAADHVWLQLNRSWQSVALFDPLGRCRYRRDYDGRQQLRLELRELPPGLYLIRLRGPDYLVTRTLIVE